MKKTLLIGFILLSYFSIFSQEESPCPKIQIIEPDSVIHSGKIMHFSVSENVKNDFEKLEFKWSVDKGKIIKGQGSSKIEVDTNGLDDITINATLEVFNLPVGCKNSFSGTALITEFKNYISIDSYEKLPLKDEISRLYILLYKKGKHI